MNISNSQELNGPGQTKRHGLKMSIIYRKFSKSAESRTLCIEQTGPWEGCQISVAQVKRWLVFPKSESSSLGGPSVICAYNGRQINEIHVQPVSLTKLWLEPKLGLKALNDGLKPKGQWKDLVITMCLPESAADLFILYHLFVKYDSK